MALNVNLLTDKAQCDVVLADLAAELDTYGNRDSNLEFADRRAERISTDVAAQLAGLNAQIAGFEAMLAVPGVTPEQRKVNESKLRRLNDRKANLTERGEARTGAVAFLADVDAEQIAAQVQVLTQAQQTVTARKAALPA